MAIMKRTDGLETNTKFLMVWHLELFLVQIHGSIFITFSMMAKRKDIK
jgi:hypothetical protein